MDVKSKNYNAEKNEWLYELEGQCTYQNWQSDGSAGARGTISATASTAYVVTQGYGVARETLNTDGYGNFVTEIHCSQNPFIYGATVCTQPPFLHRNDTDNVIILSNYPATSGNVPQINIRRPIRPAEILSPQDGQTFYGDKIDFKLKMPELASGQVCCKLEYRWSPSDDSNVSLPWKKAQSLLFIEAKLTSGISITRQSLAYQILNAHQGSADYAQMQDLLMNGKKGNGKWQVRALVLEDGGSTVNSELTSEYQNFNIDQRLSGNPAIQTAAGPEIESPYENQVFTGDLVPIKVNVRFPKEGQHCCNLALMWKPHESTGSDIGWISVDATYMNKQLDNSTQNYNRDYFSNAIMDSLNSSDPDYWEVKQIMEAGKGANGYWKIKAFLEDEQGNPVSTLGSSEYRSFRLDDGSIGSQVRWESVKAGYPSNNSK